jgi:hypothetical protein
VCSCAGGQEAGQLLGDRVACLAGFEDSLEAPKASQPSVSSRESLLGISSVLASGYKHLKADASREEEAGSRHEQRGPSTAHLHHHISQNMASSNDLTENVSISHLAEGKGRLS